MSDDEHKLFETLSYSVEWMEKLAQHPSINPAKKTLQIGGATDDTSTQKYVNVLWVRHCEGCHNVKKSDIIKFREPLCTEKGISRNAAKGAAPMARAAPPR